MLVLDGEIFIVDWNNHVVRKVDAGGFIWRAMGSGVHGDDSDGPALEVNLNHPDNIAIGPTGDFYIAGWHNWKIKKVDRNTYMVSSVAGTDDGFAGDGGPATEARISLPSSVVWDRAGSMYITDQGNTRIRKVDGLGIITTFAGGESGYADGVGEAARFAWPTGTDSYPAGKMDLAAGGEDIYLADTENHRIRKIHIATRTVTTVAGTGAAGLSGDGGPALAASFNHPTDVACTPDGGLFVADAGNHVVRRIDPDGTVRTVAGTGVPGRSPDGTPAASALLHRPSGLYWDDRSRTLYIADTFNHQVRRVKLAL
jgi:sugar lactone lactonase YvrE